VYNLYVGLSFVAGHSDTELSYVILVVTHDRYRLFDAYLENLVEDKSQIYILCSFDYVAT